MAVRSRAGSAPASWLAIATQGKRKPQTRELSAHFSNSHQLAEDRAGGWLCDLAAALLHLRGIYRGSRGRCGIAEVDGAAVSGSAEGAALLLSEFVVKRRPVMVKNAVAHDARLRPLLESMQFDALAASEWGQNTWDVSPFFGGRGLRSVRNVVK